MSTVVRSLFPTPKSGLSKDDINVGDEYRVIAHGYEPPRWVTVEVVGFDARDCVLAQRVGATKPVIRTYHTTEVFPPDYAADGEKIIVGRTAQSILHAALRELRDLHVEEYQTIALRLANEMPLDQPRSTKHSFRWVHLRDEIDRHGKSHQVFRIELLRAGAYLPISRAKVKGNGVEFSHLSDGNKAISTKFVRGHSQWTSDGHAYDAGGPEEAAMEAAEEWLSWRADRLKGITVR